VPVEDLPDPFASAFTTDEAGALEPTAPTKRRRWPIYLYSIAGLILVTLVWLVITAPLSRALEPLQDPAVRQLGKVPVHRLVEGVDAVAHFGAVSVEAKFQPILEANIVGVFNLYEAVRKHGVKRVVFASSNHVVGFYKQSERIDADDPVRPDGLYGVSKCFGENLSRFYFDRYGIETVCLRIGSSFPQVKDRRMLSTFLSYRDLVELVRCALFAPRPGHTIVFGVSDNPTKWWDNAKAAHLGYRPQDTSESQRERVESTVPPVPAGDPAGIYQGGPFVRTGPFDD